MKKSPFINVALKLS